MKTAYSQRSLALDEQICTLRSKGLIINDTDVARMWLSNVSYLRLKNYTYSFKSWDAAKQEDIFRTNTHFQDVINLYLFDRELRFIIFSALEQIEVAIKTRISNEMCEAFGAHWYLEQVHFSSSFGLDALLRSCEEKCSNTDEKYISTYRKFYTPDLPPCWMIMELLTFGDISKMFEHLMARDIKLSICASLHLPDNILTRWLHSFTHLRNKCAHHSRLVYRALKHEPILPSRKKYRFLEEVELVDTWTLYCGLCCLQFLTEKINPMSLFKTELKALIQANPHIHYDKIGFTPNWHKESIWQ